MVKLRILKKKRKRYNNNKKFSLLSKSPGLIPLASNPSIGAWHSVLYEEGCYSWTASGGDE
jgi:hypothetical protein